MADEVNTGWSVVLDETMDLEVLAKVLPQKGNLVYEYNPLRNYRLSRLMYEWRDSLHSLYDLYANYGLLIEVGDEESLSRWLYCEHKSGNRYYTAVDDCEKYESENKKYDPENGVEDGYEKVVDGSLAEHLEWCYTGSHDASRDSLEAALALCRFTEWQENDLLKGESSPEMHESGELVDFVTDELSFSLENPVTIVPQWSYDGSVNLILNDGRNIPRLVNTRFSATGRNTYEIADRKGDNDTNIYTQGDRFDIDTSLYKRTVEIPELTFVGLTSGGNLKAGNYHFYFKYSDADGNETDFVEESGLVSVFIGFDNPGAVCTGEADENTFKCARFTMTNIDAAYDYVVVYYSRNSAQANQSAYTSCFRVEKMFGVDNAHTCDVVITGFEDATEVTEADINMRYNVVSAAQTAVAASNMLLLGNVHRPDIPYEELADLSLRFLPYVREETYQLDMDRNYTIGSTSRGYYDPKVIHDGVGYWPGELYRLGVVYILPDNTLSPVFNIRGRLDVRAFGSWWSGDESGGTVNDGQYNHYNLYTAEADGDPERTMVRYDELTHYVLDPEDGEGTAAVSEVRSAYENVKGVVSLSPDNDTDTVLSIEVRVDDDVLNEVRKYANGLFFVRQERMPMTLCQGLMIGLDKNARTPTVPTAGGFVEDLVDELDGSTYVEVDDINDVNYISEGFLTRYRFKLSKKSSGFWKTFGLVVAAVAVMAAVVAASIVTCGAAAAGLAVGVAVSVSLSTAVGATTVGGVLVGAVVATAVTGAVIGATVETVRAVKRSNAVKKLEGRSTEIPSGYKRSEEDESRLIREEFADRAIIIDPKYNETAVMLCPEYETNQPYYNQIFTGNEHVLRQTVTQCTNRLREYSSDFLSNESSEPRHYYVPSYYDTTTQTEFTCRVQSVPEDAPMIGIGSDVFRSRAGWAEEAWHYEQIGVEREDDDKKINAEVVRGVYGAYLAVKGYGGGVCDTVNVMIPGYASGSMAEYVTMRMEDASPFYAVSRRFDLSSSDDWLVEPLSRISGMEDRSCGYRWSIYRGDCYICQFTHRIVRNFNDPSAPYNDLIIDEKTWRDNYDPDEPEKLGDINLGDVNAVGLGMWVTFRVRSTANLNVRTADGSWTDERLMCGHVRGWYPYLPMSVEGAYKTPDSQVHNNGFRKTVSGRYNYEMPDVPYIKNWFGTRVMYSDIHVNDAFENGYRVFRGTNFVDLPRDCGEITKMVNMGGQVLVVFEHGVGIISVSAEAVSEQAKSSYDFTNVSNAVSQITMLSDVYGTQWGDSVVSTQGALGDAGFCVYGVDTVAKKIWRVSGGTLTCISDMKVQRFLNDNLTLGERETTPIMGVRNVKSFYNTYKRDVLFTFYDNLSGFEEKVWSLCWNEVMQAFVTFYSWVPSYMENINNVPFSFNRNTSKWLAKLGLSHADSSFADGVTLTNNIIENGWSSDSEGTEETSFKAEVMDVDGSLVERTLRLGGGWTADKEYNEGKGLVGILGLVGVNLPTGEDIVYKVDYSLERDSFQNYRNFEIREIGWYHHDCESVSNIRIPVWGLYLKEGVKAGDFCSELHYRNSAGNSYADWETNRVKVVRENPGEGEVTLSEAIERDLPIYKSRAGKRLTLEPEDRINATNVVALLNIRARIWGYYAGMENSVEDYFYNYARDNAWSEEQDEATQDLTGTDGEPIYTPSGTVGQWLDCGYYESVAAVIPRWNMQFLSTDFWRHGQAGVIDISDRIYPAYWYGEQHPFEFEFVVRDDAIAAMTLTNLEIHANRVRPESLHFEVEGVGYSFRDDLVNMYFRQEAMKALYQWNGADVLYDDAFLGTQPEQRRVSTDLPHRYYARQDTFNDIYDVYKGMSASNRDYDHLSGAEVTYDRVMDSYGVWSHQRAVDEDSYDGYASDDEWMHAVVEANCRYMEDSWHIQVNPIVLCSRNEYGVDEETGKMALDSAHSLWTDQNRPKLPVCNSPLPPGTDGGDIFPDGTVANDDFPDCLRDIGYGERDIDDLDWLDDVSIHGYAWGGSGTACNRDEAPVRGRFVKVRIRYTGDELAVIDFINSIYHLSVK